VAAKKVVATIQRSTERLSLFPRSGRHGAEQGTRELVVSNLPYIAVYRLIADDVEIIGVFHGAQDKERGGNQN
jgi:toxin ParE1/3/4